MRICVHHWLVPFGVAHVEPVGTGTYITGEHAPYPCGSFPDSYIPIGVFGPNVRARAIFATPSDRWTSPAAPLRTGDEYRPLAPSGGTHDG